MPKKYRVANPHPDGEFAEHTYPADMQSLHIIQAAGGVSKITDEQRAQLKFKTVRPGDDCSDMPASSREIFLERGWIEEIREHSPIPVVEETEAEEGQ